VLFRTFETVAVDTLAAFATSRIVTLALNFPAPREQCAGVVKTARSIDEEKILDNASETVIFPEHRAVMRLY
jgi:hypothetical protein